MDRFITSVAKSDQGYNLRDVTDKVSACDHNYIRKLFHDFGNTLTELTKKGQIKVNKEIKKDA